MNSPEEESRVVSFPQWKEVLVAEAFAPKQMIAFRDSVFAFLRECKLRHAGASIMLAKQYLVALPPQDVNQAREALRWWFKAARRKPGPSASAIKGPVAKAESQSPLSMGQKVEAGLSKGPGRVDQAPLAAQDLGGADWERDLIRAIRERGFLFRTETTYREWAAKFAVFLRPRSPYGATGEDIGAFLSSLAVTLRASPATQKQALNALVFLVREALKHEPGEIAFQRAWPKERVPTVLSREECQRLFGQLDGTTRLMAELAYGSGLRLMELLRLRVHHLDLNRLQVNIHSGKGDKDRVTVLPSSLVKPLREHVERLRVLFAEDRAAKLPGVWLPEGLARKYQKAGESWEWQWLFPS